METVRVSSKGQIVIPKSLRAAFHIETGSELAIFVERDEIHLRQAEQRFARTDVAAGLGLLAKLRRLPASRAVARDRNADDLRQGLRRQGQARRCISRRGSKPGTIRFPITRSSV
jgi:AbrB family looped-hinge helix DNA binding protein